MPPTSTHDLLKHEVVDRTHVLQEHLAAQIQDHPFVVQRPAIAALATAAQEALAQLYQAAGLAEAGDAELAQ